jgi:hypothetical protein
MRGLGQYHEALHETPLRQKVNGDELRDLSANMRVVRKNRRNFRPAGLEVPMSMAG